MAYEKQNFLDGQIITADHLNHMENGIIAAQNPRNLLDNSDFRIAQAGYGGMHGTQKYACDRWYDTYGFGSFSFNESEGLTIAYGTNHAYLVQKINGASLLHGKTVTLAMQLSDGSVYAKSGVFVSDGASFRIDIATDKNVTLFSDRVEFVVTSGSMTIKWAALYEGSYTADTMPPYVPKGYAAELAECRLYYRPQQMYCLYCYSSGYAVGINFEPMRPGVMPTPVNAKAQTMIGDAVAGETNIVVTQIDRISYVANTNFTYGNYYRVFSEFSSDL